MLQYVLTALAGLALGIAGMRVWQMREPAPAKVAPDAAGAAIEPGPDAGTDAGARAEAEPSPPAPARRITPRHALIAAGGLAVAATGLLLVRGDDESAGGALVASAVAGPGGDPAKAVADVDTMIERLAARLKANPADGEGFRMLAWSYTMTGRPDRALAPYRRALELLPQSALVHSGYGEALVGVAGDKVTPEAKAEFEKALALDPKEPRAQHFLALWQAQHGQERAALDKWIALANSGPADAPWQADVRRKIAEVSTRLGVDVAARLKGPAPGAAPSLADTPGPSGGLPPALDAQTIQAANAMPAASRQAMVDQMVAGLAAKLKADPGNVDRWLLLLRSRMVLKQGEQASSDLAAARKALAGNTAGLARLNAGAIELGVPGAR